MTTKICDTGIDAVLTEDLEQPAPYYAEATQYQTKPGCWDHINVNIIERSSSKIIGSYQRNYPNIYRTFHPFKLRDKWYALYSPNYTATRLMTLPDCKDIGGENPDSIGFCPTDFFVPSLPYITSNHYENCPAITGGKCICNFKHKNECPLASPNPKIINGGYEWDKCLCKKEYKEFRNWKYQWKFSERVHGFVAGCIWGDDSSWKIEYLNLNRADEGIIERDNRFGYLELPENLTLDKAINIDIEEDNFILLKIASEEHYKISGEKA